MAEPMTDTEWDPVEADILARMRGETRTKRAGLDLPAGLRRIIADAHRDLTALDPDLVVVDVRRKHGIAYLFEPSPAVLPDVVRVMRAVALDAEQLSETACEVCGQPGRARSARPAGVYCSEHSSAGSPAA